MKSKIIAATALFACLSVQAQFGSGTGSYGTIKQVNLGASAYITNVMFWSF